MMHINVVKRGAGLKEGVKRFSIGRVSSGTGEGCVPAHALANPFKVKPWGRYERGETIALYREWLERKLAERDAEVREALNSIWLAAQKGPVELECFCTPQACHGDVVKETIEEVAS